ncbi:MAG: redoxin domain-containing protein [Candidatus Thorarchaeota archaeon]
MLLRQQNVCLNIGEKAPDFELPDQDGQIIHLSDFKGKRNVLLALNPGDLNDSCKNYLLLYADNLTRFEELDTQVLGINMDSVAKNRGWSKSLSGLGFPILSDHDPPGNVTLKYDCFVPDEGYGKRGIFVIDKRGIIRYIEVQSSSTGACPDVFHLLEILQKE